MSNINMIPLHHLGTTPRSDWLVELYDFDVKTMQAWCTGPLPQSWLEAGSKPIDICVSPEATGSERSRHTHRDRVTMKQTAGNVKWRCAALLSIEATAMLIVLISYESSQGHWPTVSLKTTSHNDLAQMTSDQTI